MNGGWWWVSEPSPAHFSDQWNVCGRSSSSPLLVALHWKSYISRKTIDRIMKRLCHFNKSLLTRGHVARLSRPPPSLYILLAPHTVCVPMGSPCKSTDDYYGYTSRQTVRSRDEGYGWRQGTYTIYYWFDPIKSISMDERTVSLSWTWINSAMI